MNQQGQVLAQHLPQAELSSVLNGQRLEEGERKCSKSNVKCINNYFTVFRLNDQRLFNLIEQAQNWQIFFLLSSCFSTTRPSMCFLTSATLFFCCFLSIVYIPKPFPNQLSLIPASKSLAQAYYSTIQTKT